VQYRSRYLFLIAPLAIAAAAAACGGSQSPPPEAPPAPASAAPAPPPEEAPAEADAGAPEEEAGATEAAEAGAPAQPTWADLKDVDQKKDFMKNVVVPKMTSVFQDFDAKHFKKVSCVTCHGKSAMKGKFDMPNPKLPKLDPAHEFAKEMKHKAAITKFMMNTVVPTMSDLLGMKPYDPETHQGFGCFNCHTMAGGGHMHGHHRK
jgi:hypothetical protein